MVSILDLTPKSPDHIIYRKLWATVLTRHVVRLPDVNALCAILDNYPNTAEKRGISPWFRVGLIDTYEKGIAVGLRIEGLVEEDDGWRLGPGCPQSGPGRHVVVVAID